MSAVAVDLAISRSTEPTGTAAAKNDDDELAPSAATGSSVATDATPAMSSAVVESLFETSDDADGPSELDALLVDLAA